MDPFWFGLALKMATSAGIVIVAAKMVEKAGPFFGAMIATLPISAGPAYVFLALEHGPAFIERSSLSSLAVNAATACYMLVFVRLADRGLGVSLSGAIGAWLIVAGLVAPAEWSFLGAVLLNGMAFAVCFALTRSSVAVAPAQLVTPRGRWDLPARAMAVTVVVAAVVLTGRLLGPRAAGLAALIPVALTSLAIVLHARVGGRATAAVLANAVPGMIGFTTGIAVLHGTVGTVGSATALSLALGVCILWNLGLILLRRYSRGARQSSVQEA